MWIQDWPSTVVVNQLLINLPGETTQLIRPTFFARQSLRCNPLSTLHSTFEYQPTRSLQLCIPPGSLNRVPASAEVRGECHLCPAGWQVTLRHLTWRVSSRSSVASLHLLLRLITNLLTTRFVPYFLRTFAWKDVIKRSRLCLPRVTRVMF